MAFPAWDHAWSWDSYLDPVASSVTPPPEIPESESASLFIFKLATHEAYTDVIQTAMESGQVLDVVSRKDVHWMIVTMATHAQAARLKWSLEIAAWDNDCDMSGVSQDPEMPRVEWARPRPPSALETFMTATSVYVSNLAESGSWVDVMALARDTGANPTIHHPKDCDYAVIDMHSRPAAETLFKRILQYICTPNDTYMGHLRRRLHVQWARPNQSARPGSSSQAEDRRKAVYVSNLGTSYDAVIEMASRVGKIARRHRKKKNNYAILTMRTHKQAKTLIHRIKTNPELKALGIDAEWARVPSPAPPTASPETHKGEL
jgi:hypothetical protein